MKTQHTTGQWKIKEIDKNNDYQIISDKPVKDSTYSYLVAKAISLYTESEEELFANANLIATAPEMLKSLIDSKSLIERCCVLLQVSPTSFEDYDTLVKTINKAANLPTQKDYRVTLWRYPDEEREPNAVDVSVFYFNEPAEDEKTALYQAKQKFIHSVYESAVEEA